MTSNETACFTGGFFMLLIQASQVKKSYADRTILEFDSFQVYQGDKIGIVGANGAGKSTLLGLLSGEIAPDEGTITLHCTCAYIRQFGEITPSRSGGENAKQTIVKETTGAHGVLFADEPTANLDREGQEWVLHKLRKAQTLLLVSHDRTLLDAVCTRIVQVKDGGLTHYTGNYTDYEVALETQQRQQTLAAQEYRKEVTQLQRALQIKKQKAAKIDRTPSRMGNSEARLGKDKKAAKQKKLEREAKVLRRRLERLKPVELKKEPPSLRIDFSLTDPPGNRHVITGHNVSFSYGDKVVLRNASFAVERGARVALTGKNGAGKTTLLRLIYEGYPGISCAPKLKLGWLRQDFSHIHPEKTVLENAERESVQNLSNLRSTLAGLLFWGDDVYKKAGVLSGGEKMRLSLAMLLTSCCNALLLDEPTNYLDLPSLKAVARVLTQYPGTILFVSHQWDFVEQVATTQLRMEEGKVLSRERYQQLHTEQKPHRAQKLLLEVRATQILGELSSATVDRKAVLEQEYAQIMQSLRELSSPCSDEG
jgi:macrolide transport system ATP-binding/permease protein